MRRLIREHRMMLQFWRLWKFPCGKYEELNWILLIEPFQTKNASKNLYMCIYLSMFLVVRNQMCTWWKGYFLLVRKLCYSKNLICYAFLFVNLDFYFTLFSLLPYILLQLYITFHKQYEYYVSFLAYSLRSPSNLSFNVWRDNIIWNRKA